MVNEIPENKYKYVIVAHVYKNKHLQGTNEHIEDFLKAFKIVG